MTERRISPAQIAGWLSRQDRFVVAAAGVAGCVAGAMRFGGVVSLAVGVLAAASAAIVLIDRRHRLIPDWLSLPLVPLGLAAGAAQSADIAARVITIALVWLGLEGLKRGLAWWRGVPVMGGGDVKLILAAAAWLDPLRLPQFLLAAALSGLGEAAIAKGRSIAFGCHLAPWLVIFVLLG